MANDERPTHDPMTAKLGCGCLVGFRPGVEGSPVTVMLVSKAAGCGVTIHVAGLPIHDHREALRPSTRLTPSVHSDYEES
jgi:hypothetical protein